MNIIRNTYQHLALLLMVAILFTACKSSPQQTDTSDTTNQKGTVKRGKITKRTQDGCYMSVTGNKLKDTLYVQLHVQDNKVSGKMISSIFEKDSRKGTLTGTMKADKTIDAVWTFMQEGTTDHISVAFKLNHSGLLQKPLKADMSTGRQVTDTAAPYSIILTPTDCNKE